MSIYARIDSGSVAEFFTTDDDITKMFSPDLVWVDCTSVANVAVGWVYANGTFSAPPAPPLAVVQAQQIATLTSAYVAAIATPVTFTTAAGVTQTFQTDPLSVRNVADMLIAFTPSGAVPAGFYWVAADNTQVPFTLADLQGLGLAMGTQGWAQFQILQTKKAAALAAKTMAKVKAVAK